MRHPIVTQPTANPKEISRIAVKKLKIVTKTYILQKNRTKFNNNKTDPKCHLCNRDEETMEHFLLTYTKLDAKKG